MTAAAPAIDSPVLRLQMPNGGRATFHENHFQKRQQLAESNEPKRRPARLWAVATAGPTGAGLATD
jgi:hypothetical protein